MAQQAAASSTNDWVPSAGAHSIQHSYAAVIFAEPLPTSRFNRLLTEVRDSFRKLGLVEEAKIATMLFEMSPGAPLRAKHGDEQAGTEYFRKIGNFVAEKATIERSSMRFDTWQYTRWVAMRSQIRGVLSAVLPVFIDLVPATQIVLEYTDLFHSAAPGPADVSAVIDMESKYLPRMPFDPMSHWHSHTGWFEPVDGHNQRLCNVDVNVLDANGPLGERRIVSIRTHQEQRLAEGRSKIESVTGGVEETLNALDGMHISLKETLGAVLASGARQMISLGDE